MNNVLSNVPRIIQFLVISERPPGVFPGRSPRRSPGSSGKMAHFHNLFPFFGIKFSVSGNSRGKIDSSFCRPDRVCRWHQRYFTSFLHYKQNLIYSENLSRSRDISLWKSEGAFQTRKVVLRSIIGSIFPGGHWRRGQLTFPFFFLPRSIARDDVNLSRRRRPSPIFPSVD